MGPRRPSPHRQLLQRRKLGRAAQPELAACVPPPPPPSAGNLLAGKPAEPLLPALPAQPSELHSARVCLVLGNHEPKRARAAGPTAGPCRLQSPEISSTWK